ncbi:MAG: restriction endonuclease [Ignavibacteriae bacterium]|nr:restriction endonuclease [Ignavibacteriota bacterium]MCB9242683.1 restriction endonuclease [Ignavibacteriales bacterium]
MTKIKNANSLVTSHEATRAGFISLALEKNRKSTPFVEEARALKEAVSEIKSPKGLLKVKEIYPALLTASGLSDKSLNYLRDEDKQKSIENLIENFLKPAGEKFKEELIYRFLLIKGDTVGGSMRNFAGFLGQVKFIRSLLASINMYGITYSWLDSDSKSWIDKIEGEVEFEDRIKALYWQNKDKSRTLLLNVNLPIIGKNVDLILLDGDHRKEREIESYEKYIALGELKGGIDPAGADEHWKTANSALNRIREAFKTKELNPNTFFVGAAIQSSMAEEIFEQLKGGKLTNAANLTLEGQLYSLCNWIVSL